MRSLFENSYANLPLTGNLIHNTANRVPMLLWIIGATHRSIVVAHVVHPKGCTLYGTGPPVTVVAQIVKLPSKFTRLPPGTAVKPYSSVAPVLGFTQRG